MYAHGILFCMCLHLYHMHVLFYMYVFYVSTSVCTCTCMHTHSSVHADVYVYMYKYTCIKIWNMNLLFLSYNYYFSLLTKSSRHFHNLHHNMAARHNHHAPTAVMFCLIFCGNKPTETTVSHIHHTEEETLLIQAVCESDNSIISLLI